MSWGPGRRSAPGRETRKAPQDRSSLCRGRGIRTFPAVGSRRRRSRRPVVDLPEPLSPASPSTSPSAIERLTRSTACTALLLAEKASKSEPRSGKSLTRSTADTSSAISTVTLVQPARCRVRRRMLEEPGRALPAHRHHPGATGGEPAARGGDTRSGGLPGMVTSSFWSRRIFGTQLMSPCVYG